MKFALIHPKDLSPVIKKALEVLSRRLCDHTGEFPACLPCGSEPEDCTLFFIGRAEQNPSVARRNLIVPQKSGGYALEISGGNVYIDGFDDPGVLYGCVDFFARCLTSLEFPGDVVHYRVDPFSKPLPDAVFSSAPDVAERGIWTWGHVIYDYRNFMDNMVLLKMNKLIVWNDHAPLNAREMLEYARACGIKLVWGFPWDVNIHKLDLRSIVNTSGEILERFEREYTGIAPDGFYFQSFTEIDSDNIGGVNVAETVTEFVNRTAGMFFEKHPGMNIEFGLHARSVKDRSDVIARVDRSIKIVWEDCGSFPFSYLPDDLSSFSQTEDFVSRIAVLRGADDRFGVVTKGFTKLDWQKFSHLDGPVIIGAASGEKQRKMLLERSRVWRYFQANWMVYGKKALEMISLMNRIKNGSLSVTALVEDGLFEEGIPFAVALFSEMLWDADAGFEALLKYAALRDDVYFS